MYSCCETSPCQGPCRHLSASSFRHLAQPFLRISKERGDATSGLQSFTPPSTWALARDVRDWTLPHQACWTLLRGKHVRLRWAAALVLQEVGPLFSTWLKTLECYSHAGSYTLGSLLSHLVLTEKSRFQTNQCLATKEGMQSKGMLQLLLRSHHLPCWNHEQYQLDRCRQILEQAHWWTLRPHLLGSGCSLQWPGNGELGQPRWIQVKWHHPQYTLCHRSKHRFPKKINVKICKKETFTLSGGCCQVEAQSASPPLKCLANKPWFFSWRYMH